MFHIFFLSPHSDPEAILGELDSGGQCVYEHELARALSGQPDFKVTILCRQNFVRADESFVNPSYKVVRIACGIHAQIRKEDIESVLPEFIEKAVAYIQNVNQDDTIIVHGHYWDGAYVSLGLKSKWKSKLPCIWTPHSLGSVKRRKFSGAQNEQYYNFIPRQTWEGYIVHESDFVVVSTKEERQSIILDYAVDDEKVRIISPGVSLVQFQNLEKKQTREKFHLPVDGKALLSLGRMVRTKGYHRSIQALAATKKKLRIPLYLIICGGAKNPTDPDEIAYKKELLFLAKDLHVDDAVFFVPAVPHEFIQDIYAASDIFLMSSAHEPFGLVTIEAMACGLPVIADRSGGSINIITHNKDGILTNFDEPDRVASQILSLCKDSQFYDRVAAAASRHAKRDYDWKQKSEQFASLYRQISRSTAEEVFQEHIKSHYFLTRHF